MFSEYRDYEDKNNYIEAKEDWNRGCPTHFHSNFEMVYFLGEHNATINGTKYNCSKNDICFVSSFDTHCFVSDNTEQLILLSFSKDTYEIFDKYNPKLFLPSYLGDKEKNKIVLKYFYCISKEINIIKKIGYLNLILGELSENYALEKKPNISSDMRDILVYINANYNEKLNREILAKKLGYSPNYFSTIFKENVGMSFVDYINMVRCQNVISMLESKSLTNYTLLEIVTRCGFDSLTTFYRAKKNLIFES